MSKVEGDKEEFIPSTDKKKCCLISMGDEKQDSGYVGATYWIVVVEPEDTANIRSYELVGF